MQTKTKNTYSKNFLNNQNYILGITEKKKLLSKFFVEKFIRNILSFLPFLNGILYSFIGIYVFLSIPFYFFGIAILEEIIQKVQFFLSMFLLFVLSYSFLVGGIKSFRFGKYEKLIDYFITTTPNKINNSIWVIIFVSLPFFIFESGIELFYKYGYINIVIGFILSYFFSKKNFVNIMSIVFFPIVILLSTIYLIIIFLQVYMIKGIKGYEYFKKYPDSSLLKRFDYIKKDIAENNHYKIQLK